MTHSRTHSRTHVFTHVLTHLLSHPPIHCASSAKRLTDLLTGLRTYRTSPSRAPSSSLHVQLAESDLMSAPQLATLASWGGRFRLLAVPCTRNEPLKARLGRLRCGRAAGPRASILLLSTPRRSWTTSSSAVPSTCPSQRRRPRSSCRSSITVRAHKPSLRRLYYSYYVCGPYGTTPAKVLHVADVYVLTRRRAFAALYLANTPFLVVRGSPISVENVSGQHGRGRRTDVARNAMAAV